MERSVVAFSSKSDYKDAFKEVLKTINSEKQTPKLIVFFAEAADMWYYAAEFKKNFPNLAKNPDVMVKVNINITSFIGSMGTIYLQYLNGHLNCTLEDISKYMVRVIATIYKNVKIPE